MAASSSAIQLEHWSNTLAPLSEGDRASVNAVSEWVKNRKPSFRNVAQIDANASSSTKDIETSVNGELETRMQSVKEHHPTLPETPLSDAPSYLAWYAKQQALIALSTHEDHVKALENISKAAEEAETLLNHLESARIHIAELRAGAKMVEEGTEGLREDAESMVERIDHLSQLAEALSLRLSYFALLPSTTSFLSSPSLSLVTTPEFTRTLDRLDIALAFVNAHSHYRDAALYKMRFEHCVVRAGTLIRMFVVGRLKQLVTDSSNSLREWEKQRYAKGKEKAFEAEDHAMMTLEDPTLKDALWTHFEREGDTLRPLLQELEKRATADANAGATEFGAILTLSDDTGRVEQQTEMQGQAQHTDVEDTAGTTDEVVEVFRAPEFASLLGECRIAYFDARKVLLAGMIASCVARMEVVAVHPNGAEAEVKDDDASKHTVSEKEVNKGETATSRLVDRSMIFLAALNEAESGLFARFFSTTVDEGRLANVAALHAHIRALSAPIDDRLRPRLNSEGGLAGLSSATLRAVDNWRDYFVRFLS